MDVLRLISFMLIASVGCVKCTDPANIPDCDDSMLAPCIEGAIRSYMRNTRGEEAALGDINLQDAQIVVAALRAKVYDPDLNLKEICKVLLKADFSSFIDCVIDAKKGCRNVPLSEEEHPDIIPSLRYLDDKEFKNFHSDYFCDEGCVSPTYNFKAKMAELISCWKAAKPALAAAQLGKISRQQCSVLRDYVQCQSENSVGCTFMLDITKLHVVSLRRNVSDCDVVNIPGTISGTTTHVTPQLDLLVLVVALTVYIISGFKYTRGTIF